MSIRCFKMVAVASVLAVVSASVLAGPPKEALKDPRLMAEYMDKRLDKSTGLEGREEQLGAALAKIVSELNPDGKELNHLTLGKYTNTVIRTMNHGGAYTHEYNDALVKMHLTAISFAKDNGLWEELVEKDLNTTEFMMKRIAAAVKMTGRKDYALKAIFEQTTCFYHLVNNMQWTGQTSVSYKSPYRNVLLASQSIGIFPDLTEKEIHEKYTIPRYRGYAKIMNVELDISPLADDGTITVSVVK